VTHDLKTWPQFFTAILDGSKTFEFRRNDRGFAVGDELLLREWDPTTESYTGRETRRRISHLLVGGFFSFGVPHGFAVLSLAAPPSGTAREPSLPTQPQFMRLLDAYERAAARYDRNSSEANEAALDAARYALRDAWRTALDSAPAPRPLAETPATYDMSIHSNPDAAAWARFFAETFPAGSLVPDEATMLGWFANAMMAMHDHDARRAAPASRSGDPGAAIDREIAEDDRAMGRPASRRGGGSDE
jgi:hypothetical protein